jgi:hypothetical protein
MQNHAVPSMNINKRAPTGALKTGNIVFLTMPEE